MAVVALVISIVAVVLTGLSLWYAHLANERAKRAERRAERGERVGALERIVGMVSNVAAAQAATDPLASYRLQAELSRLKAAIDESDSDLEASADYATDADPAKRPAAERELEEAIAASRRQV